MKKHKTKTSESKASITAIVKTLALRSAAKGKKKHNGGEVGKKREANNEVDNDEAPKDEVMSIDENNIQSQAFSFRQMAIATNNFSSDNLVGEGGFGRVYKGYLQAIDKVVAIKWLDRSGVQGKKEFLSEVFMLSLVSHSNLVNLIGYCADGDQRMLVHEFMPNGSLENHLLDVVADEALDWQARMKIAEGAAKGLEYLHETAKPPIIYRDFKTSNILLDDKLNPKLSDFGLASMGPADHKDHASTRLMGTYGYCAPEYGMTGQLTTKSDVYSFGVVFLELISGRRAVDPTKPIEEQNLVAWAEPLSKDRNMFAKMVDPRLGDKYPVKALHQALAVTAMCLQEEPTIRPLISDIVTAVESLTNPTDDPESPTQHPEIPSDDPQSPCDGTKSPSDEPESPAEEDGNSSDELESPTGIIIRGNDIEADNETLAR